MSQFESSPEKMMTEEDDDEDEDDAPRGKASKKGASKAKAARPPPKPFSGKMGGGGGDGGAGGSRGASGSGSVFLTQAERAKLDARDKKRDETACFDFLVDLRDVSGQGGTGRQGRYRANLIPDMARRRRCIDQVSAMVGSTR